MTVTHTETLVYKERAAEQEGSNMLRVCHRVTGVNRARTGNLGKSSPIQHSSMLSFQARATGSQ